jgi:hypothetical protein
MKRYIKLQGERIIDVRPLEEINLFKKEELIEQFKKEFVELETPDVTDLELLAKYIYKNKKFVATDIFLKEEETKNELSEIEYWFAKNDWIPNKIIVGEWETTDPRWTTYLEERAAKRVRRDELLALLG